MAEAVQLDSLHANGSMGRVALSVLLRQVTRAVVRLPLLVVVVVVRIRCGSASSIQLERVLWALQTLVFAVVAVLRLWLLKR